VQEKNGRTSVEPVDAARVSSWLASTEAATMRPHAASASPSDASSSMQQPQTVRERELEAEVQMLKGKLEATATIAAQPPDFALHQSCAEWLEVDGFLAGLKAMGDKDLKAIFKQYADIQEEAENSAAKETATDDVSGSGAVIDQSNPEFTEIFSWFDADGDGSITENECAAALRKFVETFDGIPGDEKEEALQSVERMSHQIIADCDANVNGTLEFPEFWKFLEEGVLKGFPPGSQAHFLKLAREGNAANAEAKEKAAAEAKEKAETDKHRISKQGLAQMFETKNITLSKGKLEELMSRIDTDGNGEIEWLEFRALARSNSDLEMFFKGLPLERVLASCFARGAADESLETFFSQKHSDVAARVLKAGHIIEALIAGHIKKQKEATKARASQEQAAGGAKYGAELKGATVEKFFEGVTGICGEPNPGACVWSERERVCVCSCVYDNEHSCVT
jgi:Ca2+-binding EF-hand superfamily protein